MFKNKDNEDDEEEMHEKLKYDEEYYNNYIKQYNKVGRFTTEEYNS